MKTQNNPTSFPLILEDGTRIMEISLLYWMIYCKELHEGTVERKKKISSDSAPDSQLLPPV